MSRDVDHLQAAEELIADVERARPDVAARSVSAAQVHALIAIAESVRELVLKVDALSRGESRPAPDEGVVRAGDLDPTPDLSNPDDYCATLSPQERRSCTWPVGHEGVHVAGNGFIAIEVWS